jgi:pyruvate/2-oxoglutarate dehydrogenase complex dihydrolipoamide dehydrogenase (E3) component
LACELYEQLKLDQFWAERLPPSRKGTRWDLILETLCVYRLIDPGSEWRLHRHWFEQARRAALHALNLAGRTISPLLPAGIYTIPEVSMVGETEESLQKKGTAYIVGRANYRENARGRIIGDQDGLLKLLFRQGDLKLIGVHVMGELATEVVHLGLIAMMCDASPNLFVETCLNMPTLGILYKTATLDALQKLQKSQKDA